MNKREGQIEDLPIFFIRQIVQVFLAEGHGLDHLHDVRFT